MPHGGKRTGAGRPPNPHGNKQSLMIRLTPDVLAYLATKDSQSNHLDEMVRRSVDFKRWIESQRK